ncbi:hypothetical protein KGF57_003847 [Candida theae]|uniref:Uncharacterized protein n=1 Tax=Candida theae TaxID=1198502 RepID=A0AAD5FXE8_9ASCO|nr:uncharacterized protein KGF57_003847 [Candida theae]KAI5954823.1 hypothetical protein KGF57_003847 [Candida theae]
MNKIPKRFEQYFKYAVGFRCKVVPPPKTTSESQFIVQNLRKLASVDFLKSTNLNSEDIIENGYQLDILFNPVHTKSLFSPVSVSDEPDQINTSHSRNIAARDKLVKQLENLIAIPRYLYVQNDEKFLNNERQIQFTHKLHERNLDLAGKYDLSLASLDNPLISITQCDDKVKGFSLRAAIRSDVQHFHKFQNIEIHKNHRYILNQLESNSF